MFIYKHLKIILLTLELRLMIMNNEENPIPNKSLEEMAEMFGRIYFSTQNYGKSGESLFLNLVKATGNSTRHTFRNFSEDKSKKSIAKIFSWYFAVLNRYEINASNVIWSKYPYVCPRCLHAPCKCESEINSIDQERLSILAIQNQSRKPETIDAWQKMFNDIYPPSTKDLGSELALSREEVVSHIYSRIFEELAEVAEVIGLDGFCDKNKDSYLENELSDVIAWLFSLLNNLNYHQNDMKFISSDIIFKYFPNKCSHCHESRCVCVKGDFAVELAEKGVIGLSHYDKLTGLANTNALDVFLKNLREESYYCLFIDIDNFGRFNKEYDHKVGDNILRTVSKAMGQAFAKYRQQGAVFRKGGEEFVLLIKTSDKDLAYMIAEETRRAVEDSKFMLGVEEVNVTISIGLVMYDPLEPSDAIVLADNFMNDAKRSGKNNIKPDHGDMDSVFRRFVARDYII